MRIKCGYGQNFINNRNDWKLKLPDRCLPRQIYNFLSRLPKSQKEKVMIDSTLDSSFCEVGHITPVKYGGVNSTLGNLQLLRICFHAEKREAKHIEDAYRVENF